MKKIILAAIIGTACAAFAALDFGSAKTALVQPPAAIAAGASNIVTFASAGYKGIGEIVVAASSAATNGTISVTVATTNAVAGGWSTFATGTFATDPTNAVYRVAMPCEYLAPVSRLTIQATGANTTASAILIAH